MLKNRKPIISQYFFDFQALPTDTKNIRTKKNAITPRQIQHINVKLFDMFLLQIFSDENYKSAAIKDFTKALNSDYQMPPLNELKTDIPSVAWEAYVKEQPKKSYVPIINVYSKKIDDDLFLIAVINDTNGKSIFIRDSLISDNSDVSDSDFDDLDDKKKAMFLKFCNGCVDVTTNFLKTRIYCIIHDCELELTEEESINKDRKFIICKCLSLLVKELELMCSIRSLDVGTRNHIKDICSVLKSADCSLAEATQIIMEGIDNDIFSPETVSKETAATFISLIHMGANYWFPEYKGKTSFNDSLKRFKFHRMIYTFNALTTPEGCSQEIREYDDEDKFFAGYFDLHSKSAKTFWLEAAKTYKILPNYAFNLISIPAIPKKINIEKLIHFKNEVSTVSDKIDQSYVKTLLLN